MIRPIVTYPDARLRSEQRAVTPEEYGGEWLHALERDLVDTLRANRALGLAAIQIGVPVRVFASCVNIELDEKTGAITTGVVIACNSEVVSTSGPDEMQDEGCLSFPGAHLRMAMPSKADVRFVTPDGADIALTLNGIEARAFLHEHDHTRGKLIIDRMSALKRRAFLQDVKRHAASAKHEAAQAAN